MLGIIPRMRERRPYKMKRLRNVILGIFEEIMLRNNYSDVQSSTNRTRVRVPNFKADSIPSTGGLHVHVGHQMILVNADRSGGIVHIVNCWHFLARNCEDRDLRISLFYVFLTASHRASEMQRTLWNYVGTKIRDELGNRLQIYFAECERPPAINPHDEIPTAVIEQCKAQLTGQGILEIFQRHLVELAKSRDISSPNPGSNEHNLEETPTAPDWRK